MIDIIGIGAHTYQSPVLIHPSWIQPRIILAHHIRWRRS